MLHQEGDSACDLTKVKPVAGVKGYYGVATNDALQLQAAIATISPIAISIAASSDAFQNYGGGVLQYTNDWDVDHAVRFTASLLTLLVVETRC